MFAACFLIKNPYLKLRTGGILLIVFLSSIITGLSLNITSILISPISEALIVAATIGALIGERAYTTVFDRIIKNKAVWSDESLGYATSLTILPFASAILSVVFSIFALMINGVGSLLWINLAVLWLLFSLINAVEIMYEQVARESGIYKSKLLLKNG